MLLPLQPSAMKWLRAGAALGGHQQPLARARAAATQTPALQSQLPLTDADADRVHPVLLMARLQEGKALALDDVRRDIERSEVSAQGAGSGVGQREDAAAKRARRVSWLGRELEMASPSVNPPLMGQHDRSTTQHSPRRSLATVCCPFPTIAPGPRRPWPSARSVTFA